MSGAGKPDPANATEAEKAAAWNVLSDEWQSQPKLAAAAGLSPRRLQLAYRALVLEGAPIISDGRGNRTTLSSVEVRAYADALHHRGVEILERASALRRTAARLEEQQRPGPKQADLFSTDSHAVQA